MVATQLKYFWNVKNPSFEEDFHVEVGTLSHDLQGVQQHHPRLFGISEPSTVAGLHSPKKLDNSHLPGIWAPKGDYRTRSSSKHPFFNGVFSVTFKEGTCLIMFGHMGVSKNRGTPIWMVYDGKPY